MRKLLYSRNMGNFLIQFIQGCNNKQLIIITQDIMIH